MKKTTFFPSFPTVGAAILGAGALVLTGCSASAPAAPGSSGGATPAKVSPAAAGTCGSLPTDRSERSERPAVRFTQGDRRGLQPLPVRDPEVGMGRLQVEED